MQALTPKPIVKWAGGKSRLLPELQARLPGSIRTYAEPFAGGAALFFALAGERLAKKRGGRTYKRAILADRNEDLVACYRAVRDHVDSLIDALGRYHYDADLFYATRELDPTKMDDVERGARLIFLNRTCYNGLWRVNASGKFNVPFGRHINPRILDEEGLRAASRALQGVDLRVADFNDVTRSLGEGDFVYFDPPYVPVSGTADFTSYASGGFGASDQERLARELVALRDRGAMVMLSNADTAETRSLYAGFATYVVRAPRFINSDPTKRGDTNELLVVSWDRPGLYE
ncbi:DNA adenine methylase [Pendulispora albinea]|uniref:Site-specific DNA-methyltransferase (adenine-specific) n=1 Tax=Pendulispora albinea TaxID=2741071 RepID=A0ABZ2LVT4_9BACT